MVKKQWVFIKNCEIPLQSDAFRTINDDTIQWRCTLCPATFSQPGITANKKHLSYPFVFIENDEISSILYSLTQIFLFF
jgi:hypothetical protein